MADSPEPLGPSAQVAADDSIDDFLSDMEYQDFPTLGTSSEWESQSIVILFDNDVHGEFSGYPRIAYLRSEESAMTPYVLTVSVGDFTTGGALCSYSHGMYATDMLNAAGYDYITLGNHEFDYGMDHLRRMTDRINAQTVCCNLSDCVADTLLYPAYAIHDFGDRRIALVGAVTPETLVHDSPRSYYDSLGNQIYTFHDDNLDQQVQRAVDAARAEGVDYVILLSHLGNESRLRHTAQSVVAHTRGIDVVLDGHSHQDYMETRQDLDGRSVMIVSTGSEFKNVGRLEIQEDGQMSVAKLPTPTILGDEPGVLAVIDSLNEVFKDIPSFAQTDYRLKGFTKEDDWDRNHEINLGDLCTDALRIMTGSDVAWINSGCFKGSIPEGGISIKELKMAFQFFNRVCVAEVTGQHLLDALEYAVSRFPADDGSFPQVSGLRFKIDSLVASPALKDSQYSFLGVAKGKPRRVHDVEVLTQGTSYIEGAVGRSVASEGGGGIWRPLDPQAVYSLASISYILKEQGSGGIFAGLPLTNDAGILDTQIYEQYLTEVCGGRVPVTYQDAQERMFCARQ